MVTGGHKEGKNEGKPETVRMPVLAYVKQAQRAKRVAKGHQLEIGAQRAPRFLVCDNPRFDL